LKKEYETASILLHKSLKYKDNLFAYKWIGQIAFMKDNYDEAVKYLIRADLTDPQVVFNLSRTYYMNNQWSRGEEFYKRLKDLSPKSDYFMHLNKLRALLRMKNPKIKPADNN
jgi:tetratricopeptide (TPR) repeat protein